LTGMITLLTGDFFSRAMAVDFVEEDDDDEADMSSSFDEGYYCD
jgi:hypothetical protein